MSRWVWMILTVAILLFAILAACISSPEFPPQTPVPSDDTEIKYKKAPDFEAVDSQGRIIKLSDYIGKKNLVIVINRGFT